MPNRMSRHTTSDGIQYSHIPRSNCDSDGRLMMLTMDSLTWQLSMQMCQRPQESIKTTIWSSDQSQMAIHIRLRGWVTPTDWQRHTSKLHLLYGWRKCFLHLQLRCHLYTWNHWGRWLKHSHSTRQLMLPINSQFHISRTRLDTQLIVVPKVVSFRRPINVDLQSVSATGWELGPLIISWNLHTWMRESTHEYAWNTSLETLRIQSLNFGRNNTKCDKLVILSNLWTIATFFASSGSNGYKADHFETPVERRLLLEKVLVFLLVLLIF